MILRPSTVQPAGVIAKIGLPDDDVQQQRRQRGEIAILNRGAAMGGGPQVTLEFPTEPYQGQRFNTTTSMGRLALNILLSFAQFEREVMYSDQPVTTSDLAAADVARAVSSDNGSIALRRRQPRWPPSSRTRSAPIITTTETQVMDKDRIIGSAKQVEGSIKEAVGKVVGDAKLQMDGKAEKVEGKAQNLLGSVKDTLKP